MDWTDEEIDQLKALREAGHTNAYIGLQLGRTRNAVGAKIDRLGLSQKTTRPNRRRQQKRQHQYDLAQGDPDAVTHIYDHQRLMAGCIALVDLEDCHCRWPIGDPQSKEFRFCGADRVPGSPYCEKHQHRATRPVKVTPKPASIPSAEPTPVVLHEPGMPMQPRPIAA